MNYVSTPLGELVNLQAGYGFPTEMQGKRSGQYPFAKVGDISRGGRSQSSVLSVADHYVDDDDVAKLRAKLIPPGSILFAKIGEAIRQNHRVVSGCEMLIDNNAMAAIPGEHIDARFLYHFLKTVDFYVLAPVTTVPALRKSELAKIKVPLPPLPEQRRIAAILDQADTLRAKRLEALAQLDSLTQSIFIEMFGDPSKLSEGARVERLGDSLRFLTSGGRGWAKYYAKTGSRFIRSLDVQMNHIGDDDCAFVIAPINAEARRTQVESGDVFLTITGSLIGRVATAPNNLAGSYISQHVAILRVNRSRIDPDFLSHFLSLELGGQRQISKVQYGQTKPGLNFEQIRDFQIPLPPIELQNEFVSRVRIVQNLKNVHQTSLVELDMLFASLQHRAFRGEL